MTGLELPPDQWQTVWHGALWKAFDDRKPAPAITNARLPVPSRKYIRPRYTFEFRRGTVRNRLIASVGRDWTPVEGIVAQAGFDRLRTLQGLSRLVGCGALERRGSGKAATYRQTGRQTRKAAA